MIDTQGNFENCIHLLNESFWCAVETNAPDNLKKK